MGPYLRFNSCCLFYRCCPWSCLIFPIAAPLLFIVAFVYNVKYLLWGLEGVETSLGYATQLLLPCFNIRAEVVRRIRNRTIPRNFAPLFCVDDCGYHHIDDFYSG